MPRSRCTGRWAAAGISGGFVVGAQFLLEKLFRKFKYEQDRKGAFLNSLKIKKKGL